MKGRLLLVIVFLSVFLFPTLPAQAIETTLPFGGLVSYSVPCTCPTSAGNLWIWFTPLYLGSKIPLSGPLVYVPFRSTLYAYFMIGVPLTWHLGTYTPGAQACEILVPPPGTGCIPLPAAGVINKVGTSKFF